MGVISLSPYVKCFVVNHYAEGPVVLTDGSPFPEEMTVSTTVLKELHDGH